MPFFKFDFSVFKNGVDVCGDPVAQDDQGAAVQHFQEGAVVVAAKDDVDSFGDLCLCSGEADVPAGDGTAEGEVCRDAGDDAGEEGANVGVKQPEERDADFVFEDRPADSELPVGLEFVAVGDVEDQALMGDGDGSAGEFEADLFGEVGPKPDVVVAGEADDAHPGLYERVEFKEDTRAQSGDHGAVLEPEFEEVSDDVEDFRIVPDGAEKGSERPFLLRPRPGGVPDAEVDIADEVDSFSGHVMLIGLGDYGFARSHFLTAAACG